MPRRLRSRPRRQPAAALLHSSTAASRARRPRGGIAARKPCNRAVGRAVPATDQGGSSGQRPQVQCRRAGGAGGGFAGMGGSAGSPFVHAGSRLRKAGAATIASTQHGRPDSPPTRRCSSHSPSCLCQQRRRQRRTSCPCSPTPRLSRQPAQPRPAGRSDVEPAACARLIRPAQRYEPASGRSSRCERHLEFAAATATAVGRQRHHALRRSEKSSAYHLKVKLAPKRSERRGTHLLHAPRGVLGSREYNHDRA